MKTILIFLFFLLIVSCKEEKHNQNLNNLNEKEEILNQSNLEKVPDLNSEKESYIVLDKNSKKKINLKKPSIIIIEFDSLEIERAKEIDGEDNFYIAADDMNWYNSKLKEQCDSLNIPIFYSDKDYNEIVTPNLTKSLTKDSTFSLYTYFYYNGENLKREELFNLLLE